MIGWFISKFWPFIIAGASIVALVLMGKQNTKLRIRAKNAEGSLKFREDMRNAGDAVITGRDGIRERLLSGDF